jgi:CitB family two-component system response regulator MalR
MIRVLLVEDDPMVAELNRRYVDQVAGFTTAGQAAGAAEALAFLAGHKVDLILLDIFMPGRNGLELLASIRAADLDIDVILVTAARDTRTIGRALKLGAVDYLIKPFEFERLQQALEHYRETHRRILGEDQVSQTEMDRFFNRQAAEGTSVPLPKGLDRITLDHAFQAIVAWTGQDGWFACEDLAKTMGLSRVSVRKYVEFLVGLKALRMELSYGGVGRPVHRYKVQRAYLDQVRKFL